jgi:hypothetical protein
MREGKKQVNYLDAIARNIYKNKADQLRAWGQRQPRRTRPGTSGFNARARAGTTGKIILPATFFYFTSRIRLSAAFLFEGSNGE